MARVLALLAGLFLTGLFAGCAAAVPDARSATASPQASAAPASSAATPAATPLASSAPAPTAAAPTRTSAPGRVKPGIEVLVEEQRQLVEGKRVGLITNPTGVAADLRGDVELLSAVPGAKLVALFAGEHGLRGAEEAGKKLEGSIDPYTGVPVYSLYGKTLAPKPEWLRDLDVLIFDIQNEVLRADGRRRGDLLHRPPGVPGGADHAQHPRCLSPLDRARHNRCAGLAGGRPRLQR